MGEGYTGALVAKCTRQGAGSLRLFIGLAVVFDRGLLVDHAAHRQDTDREIQTPEAPRQGSNEWKSALASVQHQKSIIIAL
jgi:cell division septation protein DedD